MAWLVSIIYPVSIQHIIPAPTLAMISRINSHHFFAMLIVSSLAMGCATQQVDPMSTIKVPNDTWWNDPSSLKQVKSDNAKTSTEEIPLTFLNNLAVVRTKMRAVSPIYFAIGFSADSEINAFAARKNNHNLIIFTNGFMRQFGGDQDVLATTLGHELGHHQLGHTQPKYTQKRSSTLDTVGQGLGLVSSVFIPFSGYLVSGVTKGIGLSYSRDDERAADNFGMKLALSAGYSPCGSYRYAMKMDELGKGQYPTFISTHPGNDERILSAQEFSANNNLGSCQY